MENIKRTDKDIKEVVFKEHTDEKSKDKITVVCPIYNEEKYIAACIESILSQDYPQEKMEILLIDGMSEDNTRNIILNYVQKYPFIELLDNPKKIVPTALNIGIRKASSEIIIRLDAHSIYPDNYFSMLVKYLKELDADNVGGIWETLPIDEKLISKAIAAALSHSFGMGNAYYRIGGTAEVKKVDTVPFGCFKKDIFERIGLFDEELVRNQDDEFNGRITKNNGKIYLIPSIVISYFGRDSLKKVAKMFYQYGLFKPLVNKKLGTPTNLRQFFPLLFLIGIVVGAFLSYFSTLIAMVYACILLLYLFLSFNFSARESVKQREWRLFFVLPVTFFLIHISYGWGYLKGIFKVLGRKKISVNISR